MSETKGTIYVEARIRDDITDDAKIDRISLDMLQADLEHQLSSENLTFELFEDVLDDDRSGEHKLGTLYRHAKDTLHSLKVVEYMGPDTDLTCYTTEDVNVEVQIYSLYNTPYCIDENQELPQADFTQLPHTRFANHWEELIFQNDIKIDLIWMMTNILKFSRLGEKGEINPLILLYGPPGTGKTHLCQGLAQKISIRLNNFYTQTRFIQIKTSTLLSKYYSESARKVDEIFTKIAQICHDNSDEFFCALIDEVESIASSRELSIKSGESQDSLRATNALLTGLDRMKASPNIIFLCTSNMIEVLDSAFLDRCGLKRFVGPPSIISQYEILRSKIQKLIKRGVITTVQPLETIPSYDEAILASNAGYTYHPGCKLLDIVQIIRSVNVNAKSGCEISGRSLTQLPEQAILKHLRSETCDLNMALSFLTKLTLFEQNQNKIAGNLREIGINVNSEKKRKFKVSFEEDSIADVKFKAPIFLESPNTRYKLLVEEYDV